MHFSSVAVTAALAAVSSLVTGARAADLPSITVKVRVRGSGMPRAENYAWG